MRINALVLALVALKFEFNLKVTLSCTSVTCSSIMRFVVCAFCDRSEFFLYLLCTRNNGLLLAAVMRAVCVLVSGNARLHSRLSVQWYTLCVMSVHTIAIEIRKFSVWPVPMHYNI